MQEVIVESRPDLKGTLDIFNSCVTSPVDKRGELTAIIGASRAIDCCIELLIEPSPHILEIKRNLVLLAEECQRHYDQTGSTDNQDTIRRGLKAYAGWSSLVTAGFLQDFECKGPSAAQGINLALAWVGKKRIADKYFQRIEKSLPGCNLTQSGLMSQVGLQRDDQVDTPEWFTEFEQFLEPFWKEFDLHNHQAPRIKTFHQKVQSEWIGRAAFPGPKRGAAVLTDRCMSQRQITTALAHSGPGIFSTEAHRAIAHWISGISGLNVQTVHQIPLIRPGYSSLADDWAIYYDVMLGILFRDYSSLAKDAASAEGLAAQPASYIFPTPAPLGIANSIRELLTGDSPCQDFGDLSPQLKVIVPEWTLYPSTDELKPSWAKWARSLGPLLRQFGIDALLAALIAGDLGITAKSKLYYCRVEAPEIWKATNKAYQLLGWGDAVPMP